MTLRHAVLPKRNEENEKGEGCSVKGCLGLGIFLIAIATVVITLIALV